MGKCFSFEYKLDGLHEVIKEKVLKASLKLNKTGLSMLTEFIVRFTLILKDEEGLNLILEMKINELLEEYPAQVIRFIKYDDLSAFGCFPRYPDDNITVDLESIDRDNSLLIFISHCWMRGHKNTEGWTGKPHPDNVNGDKFRLCMKGIMKFWNEFAPKMKYCYLWMDYSCMNQDRVSDELERYDKVMECCDAMFTPVVDVDHDSWAISNFSTDWMKEYKAKLWNGGPEAYLYRGWCRIEMLYAAHIPVLPNSNGIARHTLFENTLAKQCANNRRPHFLYGDKEYANTEFGHVLPPLNYSFLSDYHPLQGNLTDPSDIKHIETLIAALQTYIDNNRITVGYRGDTNENCEPHGYGIQVYPNGSIYEGEWKNNLPHGQGIIQFTEDGSYEGQWVNGYREGYGTYRYPTGTVSTGYFQKSVRVGKGREVNSDGSWYEGEYLDDAWHGKGVLVFSEGARYEGYFVNGRIDGIGIYQYADGGMYEGSFKDGNEHGQGKFTFADGMVYDGEWVNGAKHGRGVLRLPNGKVYDGQWDNNRFKP